MPETVLHLLEGAAILGLGTWVKILQQRASKVLDLELRLVAVETHQQTHAKVLEKLQEALDDVREHMARREDVQALRRDLRPKTW